MSMYDDSYRRTEEDERRNKVPGSRRERVLAYGTMGHAVCITVAVMCTVPILWQDSLNEDWREAPVQIAGQILMGAFYLSCALLAAEFFILLTRLCNLRALWRVLRWGVLWGIGIGVFSLLCIMADVQPEAPMTADTPIQADDTIHPPTDKLHGPGSMVIDIQPADFTGDRVQDIPNVRRLLSTSPGKLSRIIESTPRLVITHDNAFYSKPGHLVLVAPKGNAERADLVHAAFCRLTPGQHLPKGFHSLKPGERFSKVEDEKQVSTDIALELGENYYLLLAWRGEAAKENAAKCLNASIASFDQRLRGVVDNPSKEALRRLVEGKRNIVGSTPGFALCEPPGQFGAYQAEIYVNPGEPGNLHMRIYSRDKKLGINRHLTLRARYSENREELFRHDVPGDAPPTPGLGEWALNRLPSDFPKGAPLFVIAEGDSTKSFGVVTEVWFVPRDRPQNRRLLLRRCYKVRAYQRVEAEPEQKAAPAVLFSPHVRYLMRLVRQHIQSGLQHPVKQPQGVMRPGVTDPIPQTPLAGAVAISQAEARKVVDAFESKQPLPRELRKSLFLPTGSRILRREQGRVLEQQRRKTASPAPQQSDKAQLPPWEELREKLRTIKNSINSLIP